MFRRGSTAGHVIAFFSILCIFIIAVVSFWTDRNLDFWMTYVKEKPSDVPMVFSVLLSIFWPATVVGNVISELCRMVVT